MIERSLTIALACQAFASAALGRSKVSVEPKASVPPDSIPY
jgi:hypothetical protein